MLSASQSFFLKSLSDYLYGSSTKETVLDTDLDETFKIAQAQNLEAIIYYQNKSNLPYEIKQRYLKQYMAHSVISFDREKTLSVLVEYLRTQQIPLICMKGAVLREYYSVPALRSMGDIDIIIRNEDKYAVDEVLRQQMNFKRFIDNHAVWTYWKGNIFIEVHTHMFYEELANQIDYQIYFDRIWGHCHLDPVYGITSDNLYVPDEEFHFLYLMAHTAKHITNSGNGFRAYLDMVLMTKACDKMDLSWIEMELSKLNLLIFTRKCMTLCEKWFNVKMPFADKELDEVFYDTVTEKTFEDGLFGLNNSINKPASAAKDLKRDKTAYYFAAIKRGLRKLFPPYRDMQLIPWYSFVDGRPWLMPVAWIYRFIYCFFHKFRHSIDLLTEPFIRKKEVKNRQSYLNQWGL